MRAQEVLSGFLKSVKGRTVGEWYRKHVNEKVNIAINIKGYVMAIRIEKEPKIKMFIK